MIRRQRHSFSHIRKKRVIFSVSFFEFLGKKQVKIIIISDLANIVQCSH